MTARRSEPTGRFSVPQAQSAAARRDAQNRSTEHGGSAGNRPHSLAGSRSKTD